MPVIHHRPRAVRDTIARNIVKNGKYAVIDVANDPPTVIDADLTKEEWLTVLTAVTEFCEINYVSVTDPIKRALERS